MYFNINLKLLKEHDDDDYIFYIEYFDSALPYFQTNVRILFSRCVYIWLIDCLRPRRLGSDTSNHRRRPVRRYNVENQDIHIDIEITSG